MLLVSSIQVSSAFAESAFPEEARPAVPARTVAAPARASPYSPVKVPKHAMAYYDLYGGVDNLHVRRTASGNLIRFSYRVTDPVIAKVLADKSATPYLFGQRSRALLQIPVMDKIGQLRQSGPLEVGQEYWMVFSNKGNLIKAGDRVNVMIGSFHIDGLVVE
ncbi:hypothetical protein P3W85_42575 [Cupriavidus basilensis]|uniref:Transmembrane protein n=1 Tax=Cupriavidus basilensis TaxID=68895 RepID=A0ABT6B3Y2_9BURK|nr:hypothetical protein [Cupriavidus basilensis]MDF3839579.1 hypothetical protein [Cupriavidus basilensis]